MSIRAWLSVPLLALACGAGSGAKVVDAGPGLVCPLVAQKRCTLPAPRFAGIKPILDQACAGCHSSLDAGEPWPLTNYRDVSDWQSLVRDDLLKCTMPPLDAGVSISNDDRAALINWLDCGLQQ